MYWEDVVYCKKCGSPVNYEDIKVPGQCPHCGSGAGDGESEKEGSAVYIHYFGWPYNKGKGILTACSSRSASRTNDIRETTCPDCLEVFRLRVGNMSLGEPERCNAVHHPDHYGGKGPYEVIRVTEHFKLNHNMATIVTYLLRAGKKDPYPQDLSKALWYLVRELAVAKGEDPSEWVELIPEEFR